MLSSKISLIFALLSLVTGAPVTRDAVDNVLVVPVEKARHSKEHSLLRRDQDGENSKTYEANLQYSVIRYYINVTYGGQQQTGFLDTGSSDIFIFSDKAFPGGYNPSNSSTYHKINDDFSASYGDGGAHVQGTWATETIGIGGAEVPNYEFAYLNETSPSFPDYRGIIGFGPKSAKTSPHKGPTYTERLVQANKVKSNSFSLFTKDNDGGASLVIGGIDTAKYNGKLNVIPFSTAPFLSSQYFTVPFKFEGVSYDSGVLDTGSPSILLPQDVADSVASRYNATWRSDLNGYIIEGEPDQNWPGLDFEIGGVNVTVPIKDLFFLNGDDWFLGIGRSINQIIFTANVLGDPILKQLYLFVDADSSQLAFAPVKITNESDIVAVSDSIPDSQPAPGAGDSQGGSSGCIIC